MASTKRRTRRTTRRATTTVRSTKVVERGGVIAAVALAGVAAVGTALYLTTRSASAATPTTPVTPVTPGGTPGGLPSPGIVPVAPSSTLPATGDVWTALTAAQQVGFEQKLYSYIATSPNCPTVMQNAASQGINSYSDLAIAGNRMDAIQCWQAANNQAQSGVLDAATYTAIMGS